jgi:hypothetical protein
MDELDEYGAYNTRYEGIGTLRYFGDPPTTPIYFEVRQLVDGRLLVGCVSTGETIRETPSAIDGHLLTGEPFSTIVGRGIREIYLNNGEISKAHYVANMTRVKYTNELQPNNHSIEFALHNFIPGPNSDVSQNKFELTVHKHLFSIRPVGNYRDQANRLLRHGGNLRTSWIKTQFVDASGERQIYWNDLDDVLSGMTNAISLALGTLVTCPQHITFDPKGDRNYAEHFSSIASPFSTFIATEEWDTPVKETIDAWFNTARPIPFEQQQVAVWIRHHLDACTTELHLETRALASATLLDVIAGRYSTMWSTQLPHNISFAKKLNRLMRDVGISLPNAQLNKIVAARNSLVHAGKFVISESGSTYSEYKNLVRLGRSILLRLIGFPSNLHEAIGT